MATVTRIFRSVQYDGTNSEAVCDVANLWQSFGQTYTVDSHDETGVNLVRTDTFAITIPIGQWIVSDDSGGSPFTTAAYESTFAEL